MVHEGETIHAYSSAYLVHGDERSLIVDTGHPKDWPRIEEQLDRLEVLGIPPVEYIFPTHAEVPHAANLGRLLNRYSAAVAVGDVRDYHLFFPEFADRLRPMTTGASLELGGTELLLLDPAIKDLVTSLWAYDTRSQTLFPGDGFAYMHHHQADECWRTAEEVPDLPIPAFTALFSAYALYWTRFTDIEPHIDALDALLAKYPTSVIAPGHGFADSRSGRDLASRQRGAPPRQRLRARPVCCRCRLSRRARSAELKPTLLTPTRPEPVSGEAMLVVVVLLWSFGYTAGRYALTNGWETLQYSSSRFMIGAIVFAAVALYRERSIRIERADLIYLLPAGLVGIMLNQLSFTYSLTLTTATTVALVFGTLPIFAAILTRLLGWEVLTRRHWIATSVSFVGVALVAIGAYASLSGDLGGILLALVAVVTFAAFSVSVGPLMRKYSVYRVTAATTLAGTVPARAHLAATADCRYLAGDRTACVGRVDLHAFHVHLDDVPLVRCHRSGRREPRDALGEHAAVHRRGVRCDHPV